MSSDVLSLHLVELSPQMRQIQEAALCGYFHGHSHAKKELTNEKDTDNRNSNQMYEHEATTKYGQRVYWYSRIEDVPKSFSFYLAHEFFDALPIHKFVKTKDKVWREILIDLDEQNNKLRFVQANFKTPALHAVNFDNNCSKDAVEISPKTGVIIQHISDCIDKYGGGALIADYGENAVSEDSFRGFKEHKLHDVLTDPGSADLTADVDFSYMKRQCSEHTTFYGPITQSKFLKALGIDIRYAKLRETGNIDSKDLDLAYHSLTDEDKMGNRFKFCAIFPKTMQPIHHKYPPAGFENN